MTERVLPPLGASSPGTAGATGAVRSATPGRADGDARARRLGATTRERTPLLTMPARAGMLLGGSAALYAVTLAAVAGMQSASDADAIARRQPWLDAAQEARAANDAFESSLLAAGEEVRRYADEYQALRAAVVAHRDRLAALASLVAEVEGSAAALPARIALPDVPAPAPIATTRSTRPPARDATTGASGG